MDRPRILEIGNAAVFKRSWPERVTWLCPGGHPGKTRIPVVPPPFVTEEALPRLENELAEGAFDLVVYLAWGVPIARPNRWHLFRWNLMPARVSNPNRRVASHIFGKAYGTPVAVVDPQDAPQLDPQDLPLLDHCDAFFKRELIGDASTLFFRIVDRHRARAGVPGKIHPIPIGLSPERIAAAPTIPLDKTADIFFAGRIEGIPVRNRGLEQLRALRGEDVQVNLAERMPLAEYLECCARARLVWSPEGYGKECFRHYEAPLCGSVPVINRASTIRHQPLQEGVHCFYYDADKDDLADVVRQALADHDRLRTMAAAGRVHVLRHHTFEAICRYVVDTTLRDHRPGRQKSARWRH